DDRQAVDDVVPEERHGNRRLEVVQGERRGHPVGGHAQDLAGWVARRRDHPVDREQHYDAHQHPDDVVARADRAASHHAASLTARTVCRTYRKVAATRIAIVTTATAEPSPYWLTRKDSWKEKTDIRK